MKITLHAVVPQKTSMNIYNHRLANGEDLLCFFFHLKASRALRVFN